MINTNIMKNGKLKLKLNRNFIRKNKYQVLIDDFLIGELDYKNLKLDFETTIGKHKIIIKDEDCEIENHFYLSPQKIILPITISENFFWSKSNKFFLSIYLKGFVLGFVIVYFVIMIYLFYRNKDEVNLSFMIPLLLLLIFNTFKSNGKKVSIKIN
ncbi:hypothetical protein MASR1M104_23760 [Cloacibacterium normanense]